VVFQQEGETGRHDGGGGGDGKHYYYYEENMACGIIINFL